MVGKKNEALTRMVALWPVLPFLGFGFCAAWFMLAEATTWLSPVESDGVALTNLNVVVKIAMGAALLVSFAAGVRGCEPFCRALMSRRAVWVAAGLASAGSLTIILVGPAYLQVFLGPFSHPLFQLASVMIGVGMAVLILHLGVRYGRLPLRRSMLYLCYAHLAAVFVYMAVLISPPWAVAAGGPPFAPVIAFVLLPLLCAASLSLDPAGGPWAAASAVPHGAEALDQGGSVSGRPSAVLPRGIGQRLGTYASFACVLFAVALVQAAVCANVTNAANPSMTMSSYSLAVLLRVPLLVLFCLLAAVLEARRFNLSKFAVLLVVLLEVLVALTLVVDTGIGEWVACVGCAGFAFELLAWFLLLAVAGSHPDHDASVVELFYGAYALGTGVGSLAGAHMPALIGGSAFHVLCAVLLLPCFLALGERNVDRLFAQSKGGGSFEELLGSQLRGGPARAKGDFSRRLEAYAQSNGLSARETDALRYLVAGRGDSQIAEAMGISYNTARTHVRNVYVKLGIHDRQKLIDEINKALR